MANRIVPNLLQGVVWLLMIAASAAVIAMACWVRQFAPGWNDFAYLSVIVLFAVGLIVEIGTVTLRHLRSMDRLLKGAT